MMHNKTIFILITFVIGFVITTKAQTNEKDTLYIKYNKKLLIKKEHPYEKYIYYHFKEDIYSEDAFYFKQKNTYKKRNINNYLDLKRLINSRKIRKCIKGKKLLDDWEISEYFYKKTVYLVKKDSMIELEPNYLIE